MSQDTNKRLLLIGINARPTHTGLALYIMRNIARQHGWQVKLAQFSLKTQLLDMLEEIRAYKPDIVGVSLYIWNSVIFRQLLPDIKKAWPCKIVAGGPELSGDLSFWLAMDEIDWLITGPGEESFARLLQNPAAAPRVLNIPDTGFATRPQPWLQEDFATPEYRYIYYESSRGCPFRCSYCLSSQYGGQVEHKPLELVFEELKQLIAGKPKVIKFIDRSFNANPSRARKIWAFLAELDPPVKFHFELHPNLLQDEDFALLKTIRSELFQFEIGLQSVCKQTLTDINRQSDPIAALGKIGRLQKCGGFHIHLDCIAGLPGESINDVAATFNALYKLAPQHTQVNFLKLLPGTMLRQQAAGFEMKYQQTPPYQVLQTKWLSFEELSMLRWASRALDVFANSEHFAMSMSLLADDNPFKLYAELGQLLYQNGLLAASQFAVLAPLLLSWANSTNHPKRHLLKDYLRWDWSAMAPGGNYPQFIKHPRQNQLADIKRNSLPLFAKWGAMEPTRRQYNHAALFVPVNPGCLLPANLCWKTEHGVVRMKIPDSIYNKE